MAVTNLNRYWGIATILLVAIIIIGGIAVWAKYSPNQPVEISVPQSQEWQGEIYIDGAVTHPGFYSLLAEDSIETLIQIAGGATSSADLSKLKLYVSEAGVEQESQKVDINRAEAWLLEALPGIGETKARAIIAYREQYGSFRNINQIVKVAGIGTTTYEQIKDLITVAD